MKITREQIREHNEKNRPAHEESVAPLKRYLERRGIDFSDIINRIASFQIAIPSWALGAGGTRFGRFPIGGEPRNLEEKIDDVGLLHALNASSGAISLHIPWDIPDDTAAILQRADERGLVFDAVNSNTFQDQENQEHSYKFGSLSHTDSSVREQAVGHNLEVVQYGEQLGSKALTVWLADGSNFPGQQNMGKALMRTLDSLEKIYAGMPADWKLLIEYKPYEPNFYSMVIPDWGTSFLLASRLGERAKTLVDLGHHLPSTNIEQIVSTLLLENKLGGFHFNDSRYGDDDLTTGSVKPFQLFLIFTELLGGMPEDPSSADGPAWMIDASHNIKDPLEDLLQSVEAIKQAFAKALLLDRKALALAREKNDPVLAQEVLHDVYHIDVRPLLREARLQKNAASDPIELNRELEVRKLLIAERGTKTVATGL